MYFKATKPFILRNVDIIFLKLVKKSRSIYSTICFH